ncbi:hypothetical protein TNCV_2493121 [Trichonephila clavipes]|uniref:Uncharacterized protein n=1 Tax=Trichonephila clavipes TaxID=2585209 RepID=A0A8X6RP24_TRICX|nr:hypothetical protein TNCV_2493121 [Trichonephila clavipes]
MDELNLYQAPQDINKEEFQLERVRLQAFVAATDPGCKKELSRSGSLGGHPKMAVHRSIAIDLMFTLALEKLGWGELVALKPDGATGFFD